MMRVDGKQTPWQFEGRGTSDPVVATEDICKPVTIHIVQHEISLIKRRIKRINFAIRPVARRLGRALVEADLHSSVDHKNAAASEQRRLTTIVHFNLGIDCFRGPGRRTPISKSARSGTALISGELRNRVVVEIRET